MNKTLGQIAHDAGGFTRQWHHMGAAQKAEWEQIAQAVIDTQSAWTATADKMPEVCANVLAHYGKKQPIRAMWVPAKTLEASGDGDFGEYDEATDEIWWPEGWYETNAFEETHWMVDGQVTHWMSLPDAPK